MGQMKRRVLGTTTPFHAFKKKKKGQDLATRRLVLFIFFSTELPEWPTSSLVFCLVCTPNSTKHAPTCPPETPLSSRMVRSGRKTLKRLRLLAQSHHLVQSAALDCQIWQFEVHTLNQRFGFLESNQGLILFHR
jgi:hypothetical protein